MPNKAKKVSKKLGGLAGKAANALSGRKSRLQRLEEEAMGIRPSKKKKGKK